MNIADRIETALADVLPVYGTTPEFGASEPEKYAVYNITEKGADYGDGVDFATEYFVILSVFTPSLDFALYGRIKAAMRAAGFAYSGGGQTGTDGLFPLVTHYHLDFIGVESDG